MSSAHAARPHPPSARRSAEARAQGHLPRAPLSGLVLALLSLSASVWALSPRVIALWTALAREPLELAAEGQGALARVRAAALLGDFISLCALALVAVVLGVTLGLFVAQGPAFAGWSRGRGASFAVLSVSRTASVLWCVGLLVITLLALSEWASFDLSTLGASASAWAIQLAVLSVAALLVDVAFARARFYASLWLTRREHLDEQRAALGPPESRAARDRERRTFLRAAAHRPRTSTSRSRAEDQRASSQVEP